MVQPKFLWSLTDDGFKKAFEGNTIFDITGISEAVYCK